MNIATVTQAVEIVKTRFGQRSVVQLDLDGGLVKIWGEYDNLNLNNLKVGDKCEVQRKGKNYELIQKVESFIATSEPAAKSVTQSKFVTKMDADVQVELKKEILLKAAIYKNCFDVVNKVFDDYGFSDDNLKGIATTIFINISKKI